MDIVGSGPGCTGTAVEVVCVVDTHCDGSCGRRRWAETEKSRLSLLVFEGWFLMTCQSFVGKAYLSTQSQAKDSRLAMQLLEMVCRCDMVVLEILRHEFSCADRQ